METCEVECPSPDVFSFFVTEIWMFVFKKNRCGFGLAGVGLKMSRLIKDGTVKRWEK
jgi:hypothetical protein